MNKNNQLYLHLTPRLKSKKNKKQIVDTEIG